MKIKSRLILAAGIGGLCLPGTSAIAQPDAAAAEEAPQDVVVVSARKREESVLKVPVSVTTFSRASLEEYATADIYALTNRTPGLQAGKATGSFGPQLSLRGIGTGTLNATIDQSVSLNVDGLSMTQGLAYATALFDMQQAEVLRGPQSLFFGKNSTAGVVSITTANPTDEFEVIARAGYEVEAEEMLGEFIISGPVTDTLGLRLAARLTDMDGYENNRATAAPGSGGVDPAFDKKPNTEEVMLRGTAVWEPTSALQAILKVNYNDKKVDGDGGGGQLISCPEGTGPVPGVGIPFLHPNEDCTQDDDFYIVDLDPAAFDGIRNNGVPFYELEQVFGSLQVDYDITPTLTLSSVTGYYDGEHAVMINGTQNGYFPSTIAADTDFTREDFTQELRLTSDYNHPLNFMVGAFYHDGEMTNRNGLIPNTAVLPPQLSGFVNGFLRDGKHFIDMKAAAVFGQVLWQVRPDLELAVGARYTEEERDHRALNYNAGYIGVTGDPEYPLPTPKLESDNLSPEVSLTYTPTSNLTFFATYKEAFKSGSFDTVAAPYEVAFENGQFVGTEDKAFDDENVNGFEVGMKGRFFQNTLGLNLTAYSYNYEELQVGANEVRDDGVIAIRTLNAASAEVEGLEADFTWQPDEVPGLTVNGAAAYNHARYEDFDAAPCVGGQTFSEGCDQLPVPQVDGSGNPIYYTDDPSTPTDESTIQQVRYSAQDLSGEELLRAPEWTASLGFNYQRPVAQDWTLNLGANTYWTDDYYHNILLRDDMRQDSFFKHDASISLSDDRWTVALIGKNLGDEIICGNSVNANIANGNFFGGVITGDAMDMQGPAGKEELICQTERGREVWLQVTARF